MKFNWNESKKELKKVLAEKFPNVKFSLKKSGYDTLYLTYKDSFLSTDEVRKATVNFEGRGFDGMTDCSYCLHTEYDFGYIIIQRKLSDEFYKKFYNENIKNRSFCCGNDEFNTDMDFSSFINLDFYEMFSHNWINGWGLNPYNFLHRAISKMN